MKKSLYIIWVVVLVVTLGVTGFFVLQGKTQLFVPKKIHTHAGFVIFENNKKLNFSDMSHMKMEPCTNDNSHEEKSSPEDIQIEKAHLHDNVGDVIHMEREGATWGDFFANSHINLDYSKTTGYINGQKIENFQDKKINPYDSLVVFIGNNDPKHLKEAVTKERIMEEEKKSDSCAN